MVILPILGGFGANFRASRAKFWVNRLLRMFETFINGLSGLENSEIAKNEHSSPFNYRNIVILPILGGFGANFGTSRAQFWVNQWLRMFETFINGLIGLENSGIGTKISIIALLVSEIWWFYQFWVGLGPILGALWPNFGVTDNWECLKLL